MACLNTSADDVVNITLKGEANPLQVTATHQMWSLDQDGWVAAGQLKPGDRLAGKDGPVTVESVTADSTPTAVYNLDVDEDHQYLVTDLGALAHNTCPDPIIDAQDISIAKNVSSSDPVIGIFDIETGKVWTAPSSELADGGGGHIDLLTKIFGEDADATDDGEYLNLRGFVVTKNQTTGVFTILNNSSLNGLKAQDGKSIL